MRTQPCLPRHGYPVDGKAGLWTPRAGRRAKPHPPRHRRSCLGELVQIDGCDHEWFEERAPRCTLLVFVDDATWRLMHLRFAPCESTFEYFDAIRRYLNEHGRRVAFYSDKAGVFRVNAKEPKGGDGTTQFARALGELNIDILCANSPQAKGRVERAHQTLQDRLVTLRAPAGECPRRAPPTAIVRRPRPGVPMEGAAKADEQSCDPL